MKVEDTCRSNGNAVLVERGLRSRLLRRRARHLEARGEKLRLRRIALFFGLRHRQSEPVDPDGDSLRQAELMHDGLTGIEEAELDRTNGRRVADRHPRTPVPPLQRGFAEAIGI